jgi:hypothetical protein
MKGKIFRLLFLTAACAGGLWSCARQVAPTGGPKDITPPEVDSLYSTPNYSTNFHKKRIELRFDEWITLTEVSTQVIVSPPLAVKRVPEIKLKGKTVIVEIAPTEVLKENTTYTINFGNSVKDLHEGNPAKDLRFVFSTGDRLDSLTVNGTVRDAITGDPLENISLMLYDDLTDTVVSKGRPYYFARTDKGGQFSIHNVRSGAFQCVAIDDADQNLRWGGENERIGFVDTVLQISPASQPNVSIRLFNDFTKLRLMDKSFVRYGQIRLTYNGLPDTVNLKTDIPGVRIKKEINLDTLMVWYDQPESNSWQLLTGKDTIQVKKFSREDFMKTHRLALAGEAAPAQLRGKKRLNALQPTVQPAAVPNQPVLIPTMYQHPAKPAQFAFNQLIQSVDTSKWRLTMDSLPFHKFAVGLDTTKPRVANLQIAWKEGAICNLMLLPGAVTDFYGVANADTIQRKIVVSTEKTLGSLNLTLSSLNVGAHYVLQLINGNSQVEEERIFDATTTDKRYVFIKLPAAAYTLKLIEDRNMNNRWDTGSYSKHRQPEPLYTKKLEPLRANWEVEATFDLSGKTKEKK